MASKIKWSPRAASNLEEICNYISKDSIYYASLFAKRILSVVKNIPAFPKSGRIVPEYSNDNLREKIYEDYRIVYRIKNELRRIKLLVILKHKK
jgi:toxin ParE1/3/4